MSVKRPDIISAISIGRGIMAKPTYNEFEKAFVNTHGRPPAGIEKLRYLCENRSEQSTILKISFPNHNTEKEC